MAVLTILAVLLTLISSISAAALNQKQQQQQPQPQPLPRPRLDPTPTIIFDRQDKLSSAAAAAAAAATSLWAPRSRSVWFQKRAIIITSVFLAIFIVLIIGCAVFLRDRKYDISDEDLQAEEEEEIKWEEQGVPEHERERMRAEREDMWVRREMERKEASRLAKMEKRAEKQEAKRRKKLGLSPTATGTTPPPPTETLSKDAHSTSIQTRFIAGRWARNRLQTAIRVVRPSHAVKQRSSSTSTTVSKNASGTPGLASLSSLNPSSSNQDHTTDEPSTLRDSTDPDPASTASTDSAPIIQQTASEPPADTTSRSTDDPTPQESSTPRVNADDQIQQIQEELFPPAYIPSTSQEAIGGVGGSSSVGPLASSSRRGDEKRRMIDADLEQDRDRQYGQSAEDAEREEERRRLAIEQRLFAAGLGDDDDDVRLEDGLAPPPPLIPHAHGSAATGPGSSSPSQTLGSAWNASDGEGSGLASRQRNHSGFTHAASLNATPSTAHVATDEKAVLRALDQARDAPTPSQPSHSHYHSGPASSPSPSALAASGDALAPTAPALAVDADGFEVLDELHAGPPSEYGPSSSSQAPPTTPARSSQPSASTPSSSTSFLPAPPRPQIPGWSEFDEPYRTAAGMPSTQPAPSEAREQPSQEAIRRRSETSESGQNPSSVARVPMSATAKAKAREAGMDIEHDADMDSAAAAAATLLPSRPGVLKSLEPVSPLGRVAGGQSGGASSPSAPSAPDMYVALPQYEPARAPPTSSPSAAAAPSAPSAPPLWDDDDEDDVRV
ncbi:hypothetical protein OC846_002047 [Tilletia horrida]|uniref:Uncharacterized protein n=1 Tax=Tilletia horrida TaxID=155126 RepID=A0AAN6GS43_9BASI|nr:hypothetical protein OC846_002047 [Tilletia horrida]KAK0568259.1 hypothetical protein OC861_002123 [Tilletia horrida]